MLRSTYFHSLLIAASVSKSVVAAGLVYNWPLPKYSSEPSTELLITGSSVFHDGSEQQLGAREAAWVRPAFEAGGSLVATGILTGGWYLLLNSAFQHRKPKSTRDLQAHQELSTDFVDTVVFVPLLHPQKEPTGQREPRRDMPPSAKEAQHA
ncbi:hypothetical protein CF319_g1969 [Tilletia indica]|nr:hypothetical protein CF319_g1969 [Tilletia indica]